MLHALGVDFMAHNTKWWEAGISAFCDLPGLGDEVRAFVKGQAPQEHKTVSLGRMFGGSEVCAVGQDRDGCDTLLLSGSCKKTARGESEVCLVERREQCALSVVKVVVG